MKKNVIFILYFLILSPAWANSSGDEFVHDMFNVIKLGAIKGDYRDCPPFDERAMNEEKYDFIRSVDWGKVSGWDYRESRINRPDLYIYISDGGRSMTLGVYIEMEKCKMFEAYWIVE